MFRSTGNFDKLLDKATSNLLMEPDWPSIIQLCDLIRQNDIQPKYALTSLKKKLFSSNQHTASYALLVLESMVKNCGSSLHEELASRPFCETLYELARTTVHENVRQKLLELIQAWNFAFRKNPKYVALKDIMTSMKADGYKFPTFRESDAMFSADTAPEWADGDTCHRCRVPFSILQRKHHCRACGQVFCGQCTPKTTTLPKYGIEKEVRVCDACFDQATKPSASGKAGSDKQESDLPLEYINSSLAQQSQAPPRKTDEELREEEELQLALAISQSEAEAKEKEKFKLVNTYKTPVERSPSPVAAPAPVEDQHQNPELARYLNRSYWESLSHSDSQINEHINSTPNNRAASPSAPATAPVQVDSGSKVTPRHAAGKVENGIVDHDLEDFISTLKSQVEIFINRMKSNSSRGRSIANDTSVQTLFMNITAMHSKLLRYIQQHDDSRLHYERLQDKLTQVKDARAALDDLREEHREKLRREAEEAERQRQLQMAHKLEIMRKKKQEYLQYQRQLALQRIQEQEREMQMRQEHQKQQYLMNYMGGGGGPPPVGVPANQYGPAMPPNSAPPQVLPGSYHGYQPPSGVPTQYGGQPTPQQQMMGGGGGQNLPPQSAPPQMQHPQMAGGSMAQAQFNPSQQQQQQQPMGIGGSNYGLRQINSQPMIGQQMPPQSGLVGGGPQQNPPPQGMMIPSVSNQQMAQSQQQQQQQPQPPPGLQSPQQQFQPQQLPQDGAMKSNTEAQTAELISFD